ncbi:MAG: hypothetical protein LUQ36_08150 [Methanoregula sp.]|nr:hypothetical protein [Methanoregula sp.]
MAKTGIPYLESGESLILTTDRIRVNTVQYDLLLTTRNLILVDVRYAQFQPKMIPLLTIQSVKGGKTANGELVITLFFTETASSGGSESMVLLFSQQPGEQRKRERDEWLKNLMGLIVSVRQETSYEGVTTVEPEIGIRPSQRHQIAPEIPHPFTKVVESRPDRIELIIIPDEPESLVTEEIQEIPEMSFPQERTGPEFTPQPGTMEEIQGVFGDQTESAGTLLSQVTGTEEIPVASQEVPGSPDTTSVLEMPVIVETVPFHTEESESQETTDSVLAHEKIPCGEGADSESPATVSVSLLAAVKSLCSPSGVSGGADTCLTTYPGSEDPSGASPDGMGLSDTPALQQTSKTWEQPLASPEEFVSPDLPPSLDPLTVASPLVPQKDPPCPEPLPPEAGTKDQQVQQTAPEETPPPQGSPPTPAGHGSRRLTFIAVAAIVLVILGIAGVMVLYPQNMADSGIEPTPLPTPTIQQTPQPTPVIIPPDGVWVKVRYPHSYYGWVGNTGSIRGVTGSGDQIFRIPEIEGIVQVQMYKQDNSGDTLSVEIYRDGKVISLRNVSTPMGSLELLIDAKTGLPPAMTPVVTPTSNQTGSNVGRIMYF